MINTIMVIIINTVIIILYYYVIIIIIMFLLLSSYYYLIIIFSLLLSFYYTSIILLSSYIIIYYMILLLYYLLSATVAVSSGSIFRHCDSIEPLTNKCILYILTEACGNTCVGYTRNYLSWDEPGIGKPLVCLVIHGLVALWFLYFSECPRWRNMDQIKAHEQAQAIFPQIRPPQSP